VLINIVPLAFLWTFSIFFDYSFSTLTGVCGKVFCNLQHKFCW